MIQNETPTLAQVLNDAIEAKLLRLNVMLPGRVEKYDPTLCKADIQPLLQSKFADGTVVDLPIITNCPVQFMRTKQAGISVPLKVGDTGSIIFSQRSIDTWMLKGGITDPSDTRHHDLSDGVFWPGLMPITEVFSAPDPDNVVIQNGISKISVTPNGKFKLENPLEEFFSLMSEFVDMLTQLKSLDPLSGAIPLTPDTIIQLNLLKARFDTFKE